MLLRQKHSRDYMKNILNKFLKRFGVLGFIRVVFYPVTVLITTPIRLVKTLWNCRILVRGGWNQFNHFSPYSGIEYLFYWVSHLNLKRYGRKGISPYVGLGNYPLSRWFFYTKFSLFAYRHASTVVILMSMFSWLLSHLVWGIEVDISLVLLVLFIALISTTFYANTFALQNYNILGWIFFPLGIFGILTGNWILASVAWFATSFMSFTVVFMAFLLCTFKAMISGSMMPIVILIPAALKTCFHFYPIILEKGVSFSFIPIMKALGLYKKNVKYKQGYSLERKLNVLYFFILYAQFGLVFYFLNGEIPFMFLAGLIIFIINSSFLRFSDVHSIQMMMLSLALATVFQGSSNIGLLASFALLASPLPIFMPFPFAKNVLDVVPELAPFSVKRLIKGMEEFLLPVHSKEKILMIFDNPIVKRKDVYDGYRTLTELVRYVATEKQVHFMPDWWAVFETNYEGAPDFWGRDVESVLKNIQLWKADYIIVYQDSGSELENKWEEAGFQVLNKFSWADYDADMQGIRPYYGSTPDWWLLKK